MQVLHPEPINVYSMDRYIIYLRKSREDRDKEKHGAEDTLKRHREILTAHAARAGIYVEKIYEEVVSGETIKERPEIQKVIQECYEGKYRGILVVEVSRLSRGNQGDAQVILDCLKYSNNNNGVLVVTPTKVYDIAHNSDDEEYMEFELFMSRREFKMINKRLDRGRKQAVVEGQYMGSYRPYGYNIHDTRTARTLVPHPTEAPVVKMMFEWVGREQMALSRVARQLNNMGIPTYTGIAEWTASTVKDILCNPVHIGKVRWNDRMQVKTLVDGEIVVSRPRSNHTKHFMLYDGLHEPIVSEELFHAANNRFTTDKTKAGQELKNPLAGLLFCQKCGKAMGYRETYTNKNARPRYGHPTSQRCNVKSAAAHDVIEAVIYSMKQYIEDFEIKLNNTGNTDKASVDAQVEILQRELRKAEKRLSRLFEAWEEETISNNEFVTRKAVNNEKIESIKAQIEDLERSIPEKEDYLDKVHSLHEAIDALQDPTMRPKEKNIFLKAIISKIEYSRENREEFILDVYLR